MIKQILVVGEFMEIRLFQSDDLSMCTEVFIQTFNSAPWFDEWTTEQAKAYLTDFIHTPGFIGIVSLENNQINGILFGNRKQWWSGHEFYIQEIAITPTAQHKGVGSKIMQFLVDTITPMNIEGITLLTDRGTTAEKFYLKNGFEEIERLIFLYKSV